MEINTWKMSSVIVLLFCIVLAAPHNITRLEVPEYGSGSVELACHYVSERGDPDLHSVKWYRDDREIFRFTPESQPPTRSFNSTASSVTKSACNLQSCSIHVHIDEPWNTRIAYTCEVSTEGPRFAVVKQMKNLTVAVIMREDPVISGVPGSVQPGEELLLNCSAGPAAPVPDVVWYVDGTPQPSEPWMSSSPAPGEDGEARVSWRALRLRAAAARLRCEATQRVRPPAARHATATLLLAGSPNLSMFTAAGSAPALRLGRESCTLVVLYLLLRFVC